MPVSDCPDSPVRCTPEHGPRASSRVTLIVLCVIAVYFLLLSGGGISAFFVGDDGPNLTISHGYWRYPASRILRATVTVFTPAYRPAGGLFYRSMYSTFGFNPLAFRLACFVLLVANLFLTYHVIRRLAGPTASLTALAFICYHGSLTDLYWSNGTVYDLLCYLFFYSAVLAYLGAREQRSGRAWFGFVSTLALFCLATGAKEMALTLPGVLLAFELLQVVPARVSIVTRGAWIAILGAVSCGVLLSKLIAVTMLSQYSAYEISWHPTPLFKAYKHYLSLIVYSPSSITNVQFLGILAGLGLLGIVLRRRLYWFGLSLLLITLIPVSLIPPRAGFVLYLPLVGLGIGVAATIDRLLAIVSQRCDRLTRVASALTPLVVLAVLLPIHLQGRTPFLEPVEHYHQLTRGFFEGLKDDYPELPPGSRILIQDDPFSEEEWILLFLTRLLFDDPRIWLDRQKSLGEVDELELTLYDYVGSYNGNQVSLSPNSLRFDSQESPVGVEFSRDHVLAGETYTVKIPSLAGKSIDLAYYVQEEGRVWQSGVSRNWAQLDDAGESVIAVPVGIPTGEVVVDAIRASSGPWRPATGSIAVIGTEW